MTDIQKNIRLGQAVNLAQNEILNGMSPKYLIEKEELAVRTGFYYDFLTEMSNKI